ncbi:MAG: bestrophin family ion channel [Vicingaceae bacterium]
MLYHFSNNIFKQTAGIVWYNFKSIFIFIILGNVAYLCDQILGMHMVAIPVIPVTILGGGLAIFLAIRNNAAYDRWWEARKIWGQIVNTSRHFGSQVMAYLTMRHAGPDLNETRLAELQKRMINRHIAWINALRLSLRMKDNWEEIKKYLTPEEYAKLLSAPNKATQINHFQALDLTHALNLGAIEDFRHLGMMTSIKDFYDQQGKCERIKKTVFPFYYTYFTGVFLWMFIILLPFTLVGHMNYLSVPLSVAISFAFYILDKTGNITEEPFENRASDIPMTSLCRTIEVDMLHQLGEEKLPEPIAREYTKFGAEFLR